MNRTYRETKNDLIHCPFNHNHLVKRSRLITHKKICPDKNICGLVQCPYNPSHHISIKYLEKHKEKCLDRFEIESVLANEMEAYIKGLKTGQVKKNINSNIPTEEKEKENNKNKANEIIGLDEKKRNGKNNKKKKEKKIEEKMIDLENISNKELFNYMFNDRMCIEYDSDSSENDNIRDELNENENEDEMQKADD